MRFEKCMGTLREFGFGLGTIGGHRGRLYKVWEVYGDLIGAIGGRLYEVWEVYWDPMDVIRGRLFEVCEVLRRFWMIEGLI